mmetsp:Transcript_17683/g.36040  ORF Transcript_17683/g.36040 Transcript_17683/m.36040 type:complete len:270 (-) Transcript_17683:752-1561(-)
MLLDLAANNLPNSLVALHRGPTSGYTNDDATVPMTVVKICGAILCNSYVMLQTSAPVCATWPVEVTAAALGVETVFPRASVVVVSVRSTTEMEVTTSVSPPSSPLRRAAMGELILSSVRRIILAATRYWGLVCCIWAGGISLWGKGGGWRFFLARATAAAARTAAGLVTHWMGPAPTKTRISSRTWTGTDPSNSSMQAATATSAWAATSGGWSTWTQVMMVRMRSQRISRASWRSSSSAEGSRSVGVERTSSTRTTPILTSERSSRMRK